MSSKLRTETNTRAMEKHIRVAFNRSMVSFRPPIPGERHVPHRRRIQTDFEHGQWWVTDLDTGAQWAACDEETPFGPGFCFEQVSRGEEDLTA